MKWTFIIIIIFLTACNTVKPTSSSNTSIYLPKSDQDTSDGGQEGIYNDSSKVVDEKIDSAKGILEEETPSVDKSYNIAVVLPFMTERVPLDYTPYKIKTDMELNQEVMDNLDFYMGLKLAVDDFKNKNTKYNIFILDDANNDYLVKRIINERPFPDIDILISGTKKRVSKDLINFSEENKVPFYSPFTTEISQSTSSYFHTTVPNITSQFSQLFDHIYPQIPEASIYIIQEENNDSARTAIRVVENFIKKTYNISPIIITNPQNTVNELGEIIPFFAPTSTSIVFVASNNPIFVKNLLPKLYTAPFPTYILGMPSWNNMKGLENSTQPNPDIYIPVFEVSKKTKTEKELFITRFISEYQKEHNENVYLGYDLMTYVLTGLEKKQIWNNPTSSELKIKPYYYGFDFTPVMKNNSVQYYTNDKVSIYKYESGRFINITP